MTSKRKQLIEDRRAADPIAQAVGRTDIDYESDELPTAPRTFGEMLVDDFILPEPGDDQSAAWLAQHRCPVWGWLADELSKPSEESKG